MEEKKLVPKRRFEGFNKNLNKEILKNLGSFGKTYSFSRSREGDGIYHHIHYGDIHTKNFGIIHEDTEVPAITEMNHFETVKKGDIVIADASEDYNDLGKVVVIGELKKKKVIAGLHTFKFTPNSKLLSEYFLYYSQTNYYRKFSAKIGTGISVFGISKENLSKLNLNLPNHDEQQKIGKFFRVLDERIANQERKIAKVKALKEAYLAEMFPQEGETVPKRRFKGFKGEWEIFKVGEIANRLDNLRIPIAESKRIKGTTPYYGANGIQDYVKGHTHDGENVLLAEDGANDLNNYPVYYTNGEIWVNNHAHVLKGKLTILDNLFLSYLLKTINMQPYLVGGGRAKLNADVMMKIKCKIPELTEQQKIGAFFKHLDDQIEAEEAKLEKLKQMKEAYLEEMFV